MKRALAGLAVAALGALAVATSSPAMAADPPPLQRLHPDTGAAGSAYKIAVIYQHANWGGARIEWYGGAKCTTGYGNIDYSEKALDQENFDNRTSSLRDMAQCDTKLWQFSNFRGEHSGGSDGWFNAGNDSAHKYNLNVWNDRASSIQWS